MRLLVFGLHVRHVFPPDGGDSPAEERRVQPFFPFPATRRFSYDELFPNRGMKPDRIPGPNHVRQNIFFPRGLPRICAFFSVHQTSRAHLFGPLEEMTIPFSRKRAPLLS